MSKRWKTTRVLVGDPEHVISAERAKELLANNMKYAATGPAPHAITHDFLEAADILSNNVINHLSNNGQYDQFTLESIASMTDDFVEAVGNPKNAQAVSDAISQQPASNGKIYTTHQLLCTEKAVLDSFDYRQAAHHMLSEAYYPRTWRQGNFETVVPQGSEDLVKGAIDIVHSRNELTNREWKWCFIDEPNNADRYAHQRKLARKAITQDLDPEHVEAMNRYYGVNDDDEPGYLVDVMGDDDVLFESRTEDGKVLKGKEALLQNVNQIYDDLINANMNVNQLYAYNHRHETLLNPSLLNDFVYESKPVIQGNGPHGTNEEYDFEESDLTVGLDDLSDEASVSQDGPQQ